MGATCVLGLLAAPVGADSGDVAFDAGLQWNLARIGAEPAWATATGEGATIAVIDSGVALDHEDLVDKLDPGVACRDTDGDPARCNGSAQDDDGHGTHVAGVAAASTGNGLGVAGAAPGARILPVKVLFSACDTCLSTGQAQDVSAAVRWAADRGATVINVSLGSTASAVFGPGFADAVRYAWAKGSIPVVAAGNDYVLTADLGGAPAVVVSATDRDDGVPEYSNGVAEARWAVAAPGGDGSDTPESCSQQGEPRGILSTYWSDADPSGAYACLSGTSMAAPHVSGALAVLRSAGLPPDAAVQRLLDTAADLGEPGRDPLFGAGRIDLAAALAGVGDAVPAADTDTPSAAATLPSGQAAAPEPQPFHDEGSDAEPSLALVALAGLLVAGTGTASAVALTRSRRRPNRL
jgi:subtilisin family serine protease